MRINMLRRFCKVCCVVSWVMLFALLTCIAEARDNDMLLKQLQETITMVRAGSTLTIRSSAAEQIANLTRKIDPKKIDDKTLAELISILDISDDSVRFWVAASLGNLGPRARAAVPKLLKILPEADRINGALTSAGAIRHALERIGVTPPPRPKTKRIAG